MHNADSVVSLTAFLRREIQEQDTDFNVSVLDQSMHPSRRCVKHLPYLRGGKYSKSAALLALRQAFTAFARWQIQQKRSAVGAASSIYRICAVANTAKAQRCWRCVICRYKTLQK